MKGIFITFEGCEGAGKSLQSKLLYEYLLSCNKDVLLIREPGGTAISEKIREIILDPAAKEMHPFTEVLLYAASRAQLVNEVIAPALSEGKIVLCDRYVDSSIAYQGYGRGLGYAAVNAVNSYATAGVVPHITFYISLEPEKGLLRNKKEGKTDRLEKEKLEFHKLVFHGYGEIADKYKNRYMIVDGELKIDEIHNIIVEKVNSFLKEE